MASTFQQLQGRLGYDLLTQMQKDLGVKGPSAGYEMVNEEGGPSAFYGTKQAQALGGFDPSVFNDYTFDFQSTGKGNAGRVTAYDKTGNKVGSWDQKDEQLGESLMNAGMLAAAAFGGLGLAGHGPLAGALGGSGGGAAAATAGEAGTGGMLTGLDAAALDAGAGAVAGGAEAAAGAAVAGDSAVKAALFGGPGYGAGMTGAATSAFDTVLGLTGSTGLAGAAASAAGAVSSGANWLSSAWSSISGSGSPLGGLFGGSNVLRDILGLVGAGVQQYNLEKMAKDNRDWQSAEREKDRQAQLKKEADTRRRQMPAGGGMLPKFRVIQGGGNGG